MAKIRILRVITWLPVGGIERKIVQVLPRLDGERFEVSLACLRERGPLAEQLEAAGVRVHCLDFRRRWDIGALRRLAALMRASKIDLVHSHMYRAGVPATVAARIAGVRRVWAQIHNVGTWETRRQLAMDRLLCRWRTGVIAVSEKVRREAIEQLRLAPERVRLIYNGVDLDRFGTGRGREDMRKEFGAEPKDVIFLMASRLLEQKRPQDFLALARRLLQEEKSSKRRARAQFWIAGAGPLLEEIRAAASELPDPDRVKFLGRRDDVERVMAAADVFVLASTREGFSNALLEAMASGLAVIATDVGGNAEAARDGRDALIVPPLAPEPLHEAAVRLLEDSSLRDRLAANARERAKKFSLTAMIRNVEQLYEQSAAPKPSVD